MLKLNSCFNSKVMYADFKNYIRIDTQNVWPNIITKGCRFHFAQTGWWKVQNLCLSTHYCDGISEIGQYSKNIFGLPLLNEHDVEISFTKDLIFQAWWWKTKSIYELSHRKIYKSIVKLTFSQIDKYEQ